MSIVVRKTLFLKRVMRRCFGSELRTTREATVSGRRLWAELACDYKVDDVFFAKGDHLFFNSKGRPITKLSEFSHSIVGGGTGDIQLELFGRRAFGHTHVGAGKSIPLNGDGIAAFLVVDQVLDTGVIMSFELVVADGVGKEKADYVSSMEAVQSYYTGRAEGLSVAESVVFAHQWIRHNKRVSASSASVSLERQTAFVVASVRSDGKATFVSCGDPRAYVLRCPQAGHRGEVQWYSIDYSRAMSEAVSALGEDVLEIKLPICGERLVHLEEQYQAKLESGSEANVLFATLGNMRDEVFLFREASTQLHHKDRIILCSDGVWGVAPKFGHALQQLSDQGNNFDRICAFLNARSADSADDGSFIVAEVLA